MFSIGVDIGGMSIKGGLVNEKGEVLSTFDLVVDRTINGEIIADQLCDLINSFISKNNLSKKDIVGIGMGFPGPVNTKEGVLGFASNLHWEGLPLKTIVETKTGIKTRITNDANAAALGEFKFGAGKLVKNMVMITLGTGVGSGIVIDGKLFEGGEGKGAELGHMTLVLNGEPCGCGRRGCLESYASATALMRDTKRAMKKNKDSELWNEVNGDINAVNGKTVFDAAKKGDKTANEVVDQYVEYLSNGIMSICNIFRPEAIVLSGGISKQGKYLTDKIKKYCEKYHYGYNKTPVPDILEATVGYQSGIIGAAALFF